VLIFPPLSRYIFLALSRSGFLGLAIPFSLLFVRFQPFAVPDHAGTGKIITGFEFCFKACYCRGLTSKAFPALVLL
jgi:hypothetical protein